MKIASFRLLNFKRFTDLVVKEIPSTAKLVVVVGPNGCGKSSLFDAFLQWYRGRVGFGYHGDELYYRKDSTQTFTWQESVTLSLHGSPTIRKGCLYVRTAYRNDPDFSVTSFSRPDIPTEGVRVERAIQNDVAVSDNYRRLVYDTMAGLYDTANDKKTVETLRDELIGKIKESMRRVFGDLILNNLSDPLGEGAFFFEKGTSRSYHFKNLSGGEKAAFDLLLDLHVKKKFYDNAIYCIDEVEAHLHTKVQGTLLRELVRILPNQAQLWVTTHSLGVLRAAQEMAVTNPDSVCVIDFDGVDLDVPHELVPSSLGRVSWEKMLSITLDDLSTRIAPKTVIICEGSSIGTRRKDFDAEIYNRVLASHFPDLVFISGGSSNQVTATGVSTKDALSRILPNSRFVSLADRDDKSNAEVTAAEAAGTLILPERNLESYLFADDVIEAVVNSVNQQPQLQAALQLKNHAVANSVARGNPADDLKSAAGEIYAELKKLLGLKRCGNTTDAFMRDTLAPLIVPGMTTYVSLQAAIIDRLPT